MIRFEEMQQHIWQLVHTLPTPSKQLVALTTLASKASHSDYVVAEPVIARINIPRFDVSAMDGYALASSDNNTTRQIIGESSAGHAYAGECPKQGCIRIMTGAIVPSGYDSVVMQENIHLLTTDIPTIELVHTPHAGEHIRYAGEEVREGDILLPAGHILAAADFMLLAAAGIQKLSVYRPLRVGVLSCGDELCEPGSQLGNESIYDCNRISLMALLRDMPVDIIDLGIVRDQLDILTQQLQHAALRCNVIITSAGVSVGDYDYLRQAVASLGTIDHYKIAMKPGKPFVVGHIGETLYFGLPGNPVSSFLGFIQLIKPALWQRAGANPVPQPITLNATLTQPIYKKPGRLEFQRGYLSPNVHPNAIQQWQVEPVGYGQDSHRVAALAAANCLLVLPLESANQPIGASVEVQLLSHQWRASSLNTPVLFDLPKHNRPLPDHSITDPLLT